MDSLLQPGERRVVDGRERVYYDGHWIKAYPVPADTLVAKRALIEALTRRLFKHVEHGINVPGSRLGEARRAYDAETQADRKRVAGAMLAGALFNRATDILTLHSHRFPVAEIGDSDGSPVTGFWGVSVVPEKGDECRRSPVTVAPGVDCPSRA